MLKEIALNRPWFMKKTADEDVRLSKADALRTQATPERAMGVPRKLNPEIGMVLVGTAFFGLSAVITVGDPSKNILLF